MNLIVFDLEWNIVSAQNVFVPRYRIDAAGEIIQIAVRTPAATRWILLK